MLKKLNYEIKKNTDAYLDESSKALKPQPVGDEPAGQGPLTDQGPCPLTLTEGGADPAGSRLARESPQSSVRGAPAGAADGASPRCGSRACTDFEDVGVRARSFDRLMGPATFGVGG